jgi:hypothetical protein
MAKVYKSIRRNESLSIYDFEGPISSIQNYLDGLAKEYGESACIDICQSWDELEISIQYNSPESDKERDKRLADARKARVKNAEQAEKVEAAERAELARLQEKFA